MSEALCMEAVVDQQAKAAEGPGGGAMVARARALPVRAGPVLAFMFTAGGLAMVPWLFVLTAWLPATTVVPHYRIAWVGLDAVEGAGLFATGCLLARGDQRYVLTSAVTATTLLIDAWFDVLGATTSGQLLLSVIMAVFEEIPAAAVCIVLAIRALRPDPASAPSASA